MKALALALALAALAPSARACELPRPAPRAALTPPGPAAVVEVDARRGGDDDRGWRDGGREGWRRQAPGWFAWRARERAELRVEYARLDDARARFFAFPRPPWRVHRFEAWYAHEHAELDARWARVS